MQTSALDDDQRTAAQLCSERQHLCADAVPAMNSVELSAAVHAAHSGDSAAEQNNQCDSTKHPEMLNIVTLNL